MSATEVNQRLADEGLLEGQPGAWRPTEAGREHSTEEERDNGYGGSAARSWGFLMWGSEVIEAISGTRFGDVTWFCDECHASLSSQPDFSDSNTEWTCAACGHENTIDESEIREGD